MLITCASDLPGRETPLEADSTVEVYLKLYQNSLFKVVQLDCGGHLGQTAAAV